MRILLCIAMIIVANLVVLGSAGKHRRGKYFDDYRSGPFSGPYDRYGHDYSDGYLRHHRDHGPIGNGRFYHGEGRHYDRYPHGPAAPYDFGYNSEDGDGAHGHSQVSDGRGVRGQYTIQLADGRSRRVEYVADEGGFRAKVDTNEPGTESKDPADAEFRSSALPGDEAAIRFGPRPGDRFYDGPSKYNRRGFHHGNRHYSKDGYNRW